MTFQSRYFVIGCVLLPGCLAQDGVNFTVAGDWDVRVNVPGRQPQVLHVSPAEIISVTAERYADIPIYNPKAGGWIRGVQLKGVRAQETTSPHLLDPASFSLKVGPESNARAFTKDKDYQVDLDWGTFGRLAEGGITAGEEVYAAYRYAQLRLDTVVLTNDNQVVLRKGTPRSAAPLPAELAPGERLLGTIYLPGFISRLSGDHLFPKIEDAYPKTAIPQSEAIRRIRKRLASGEKLRVLAWGDSVTDGSYLPQEERWQQQFVERLRAQYPAAPIELLTQAWGGRNTSSYLAEPPGSPHNYQETVLNLKPDVIISEFVNDAGLNPEQVDARYSKLLADFRAIGAEWIILTPHYVRPDWMGLTQERDIDQDPRPYVAGLRKFAASHDVALADASLRYGRLWRQGIPYNTLMVNAINHPDARGMRIFADALMALFQD
jgi:lysophospholipase L1-like esterase